MIRVDTAADLGDLFDGQKFEVAVQFHDRDVIDIIGVGHTVAEAVADARRTLAEWRASAALEAVRRTNAIEREAARGPRR